MFYHNPKARIPSQTLGSVGEWVSLRKLGVASKKYSLIQPTLPLALGIRKKIATKIDLSFEAMYQFNFSDYLDDVSNEPYLPASSFSSDLAYQMHNRSTEPIDALHGKDRIAELSKNNLLKNGEVSRVSGNRGVKRIFSSFDSIIATHFGVIYWIDPRMR